VRRIVGLEPGREEGIADGKADSVPDRSVSACPFCPIRARVPGFDDRRQVLLAENTTKAAGLARDSTVFESRAS
jgi:hypothetical protein